MTRPAIAAVASFAATGLAGAWAASVTGRRTSREDGDSAAMPRISTAVSSRARADGAGAGFESRSGIAGAPACGCGATAAPWGCCSCRRPGNGSSARPPVASAGAGRASTGAVGRDGAVGAGVDAAGAPVRSDWRCVDRSSRPASAIAAGAGGLAFCSNAGGGVTGGISVDRLPPSSCTRVTRPTESTTTAAIETGTRQRRSVEDRGRGRAPTSRCAAASMAASRRAGGISLPASR